jgi:hypothetical protein
MRGERAVIDPERGRAVPTSEGEWPRHHEDTVVHERAHPRSLAMGVLVAAAEEERFVREKHTRRFPGRAIDACLAMASVEAREVTDVAVSVQPGRDAHRMLFHALREARAGGLAVLRYEVGRAISRQRSLARFLLERWPARSLPRVASPCPRGRELLRLAVRGRGAARGRRLG